MSVGVIGASGYLGQYVVDELRTQDRPVVGFDISPSDELLSRAETDDDLDVVRGDMTDYSELTELVTAHGVDELIQLAYFGGSNPGLMKPAGNHPYKASNTNVTGINNILELIRQFDLDSAVFASSTVVYGSPDFYADLGIEKVDETSPNHPESVYGACKLHNEHLVRKYRDMYGVDVTCLRIPLIYGPERYGGAAPFLVELFETAASGGSMKIDDGDTTWDLLYEKDIGPLFTSVLAEGSYPHTAYNIIGHSVTSRELAETALAHGHPDASFTIDGGATNEVPPVDDSRFRETFSFRPEYTGSKAAADYLAESTSSS